ncbi:MAG: COR domain-containing protein, partial [Candidatus Thiodiazotropha sp.]
MSEDKQPAAYSNDKQSKSGSGREDSSVKSNEEGETNASVEQEATAIFRQFMYQAMQGEGMAAGGDSSLATIEHTPAYEIGRQLMMIGDNIERKYEPEFKDLIAHLRSEATGRRSYITFILLMKKFIDILKGSISFPINMIKASLQTLVTIWLNPTVLDEGAPDEPDSAKTAVQDLDEKAVKTYFKALMNGTETARHIRIMVIGMFGAGKTSLVHNLLSLDNTDFESTDGIDIHVNECFINENDEWSFQESQFAEMTDYKYRVASLMSKTKISADVVADSDNIKVVYHRKNAAEKEAGRQSSVSVEEVREMKKLLGTYKDSDPVLANYWKDIYDAWELIELNAKEGKSEIKTTTQATVSVWDFAGQDVYYSTHHIFMNPSSIYLLTMDVSIPLANKIAEGGSKTLFTYFHKETTCLDAFKFWLNSIHTYSAKYGEISPTVILVGTHIDKLDGTEEEKLQKGEKYFDDALKSFINSPALQHVHSRKFFVDNTNAEEDFDSLRREILDLARTHRSWNQVVPARWILLERSLEQLKCEGNEIITLEGLMENDRKNEYPVDNKNELKDFLRFHHSLGNLLYFDTEPLENHIILSPQWIVDAFRCFVTSFPKKDPAKLKLWDEYEKQAKLSPELLQSIIDKNKCLTDYEAEVVKYMEHLDIMAQPSVYVTNTHDAVSDLNSTGDETTAKKTIAQDQEKTSDTGEEDEKKKEKLDFHIVPCMLNAKPLEDFMEKIINPRNALKTSVLCYVFSGKFLPPVIFHRLIAVCINKWPLSVRGEQFLLYRGLAVFNLTPSIELAVWMNEYVIFCRIILYTSMDKGIPPELCVETRKFIVVTLQKLLGIYKDKWSIAVLPFEEHIHSNQVKDPLKGLIPVKDLVS